MSKIYPVFSFILALCPDFGLFLFDVVSDILNGVNFIKGGYTLWGSSVIGVTLLPMTIFYTGSLYALYTSSAWKKKLLILLLAPILAPVAIPLATVAYIVYVAYVFARKCFQLDHTPDDGQGGQTAGVFKLLEGVLEANIQAALGSFTYLVLSKAWKISFNIKEAIMSQKG